jgi:RNA polymerase sigma factor (sigma-70 family)
VEASALQPSTAISGFSGRSPLLRLQSDERLVALTRRGNQAAFEALVQRYQPRLLAFCRHMLSSQEDAEDVLQEVFAAAYNALLADERKINARPWLYRIARNRSLNHLRKPRPAGQDSMDIFERDHGTTTADTVHSREEFRNIIADVGVLPESQRTALLLREIDALSYDQIAEAMDTTVPSVKSLLVRARVSLAEASEARLLTCAEVRLELGQVAEGLTKTSAPVRRHLKGCDRCRLFRGELRSTTKALAAIYPIGPLIILKKLSLAQLGLGGGAAAGGAAAGGGSTIAGSAGLAGGAAAAASGGAAAAGSAISAGLGTIASKAAAGMAAAAIVTAGAVEVKHVTSPQPVTRPQVAAAVVPAAPSSASHAPARRESISASQQKPAELVAEKPAPVAPAPAPPVEEPTTVAAVPPPPTEVQEEVGTVTLPPRTDPVITIPPPPGGDTGSLPPIEVPPPTTTAPTGPTSPPPAPPAGEPAPTQKPLPLPPPPAPVRQVLGEVASAADAAAALIPVR